MTSETLATTRAAWWREMDVELCARAEHARAFAAAAEKEAPLSETCMICHGDGLQPHGGGVNVWSGR